MAGDGISRVRLAALQHQTLSRHNFHPLRGHSQLQLSKNRDRNDPRLVNLDDSYLHRPGYSYSLACFCPFLQVKRRVSSLKIDFFRLSTPQFIMAYGTVPPIICFLVTALKFTVAEPRPNFLHRCFDGPKSSVQVALSGKNQNVAVQSLFIRLRDHELQQLHLSKCPNRRQLLPKRKPDPSYWRTHVFPQR